MKKQPIHQNLNTSFVNVAALVRYLQRLQFVGSIRIELSSYEADIVFTDSKTIRGREYDHIAGRISHGEHTLQRILIRAKEPHGRIHVYKAVEGYAGHDDGSVFVHKTIVHDAREMATSAGGSAMAIDSNSEFVMSGQDSEMALVLAALSEFLRVIDESLAKGKLSFPPAFRLACEAISADFPFMKVHPQAIVYKGGEIRLNAAAEVGTVASAVFAALKPIFDRLRGERKYDELRHILSDRLREMSTERRTEYVQLALIDYIEELLASDC
jgi:hypothetical protein